MQTPHAVDLLKSGRPIFLGQAFSALTSQERWHIEVVSGNFASDFANVFLPAFSSGQSRGSPSRGSMFSATEFLFWLDPKAATLSAPCRAHFFLKYPWRQPKPQRQPSAAERNALNSAQN